MGPSLDVWVPYPVPGPPTYPEAVLFRHLGPLPHPRAPTYLRAGQCHPDSWVSHPVLPGHLGSPGSGGQALDTRVPTVVDLDPLDPAARTGGVMPGVTGGRPLGADSCALLQQCAEHQALEGQHR